MSDDSTPQREHESGTAHFPHHTMHRATRYVDRDDPPHSVDRNGSWRSTERRRSRSPGASSNSGSSLPWVDQRLPRSDSTPSVKPLATPTSASSKPPIARPAATAATKRMATDITKWNRKQAELHSAADVVETYQPDAPSSSAATAAVCDSAEAGPSVDRTRLAVDDMTEQALSQYDYKDLGRIACLLCQRKFKSADTLYRHESESQLHKDNLASIDTCRQAVVRKLDALTPATPSDKVVVTGAPSAPPQYRDRASERRAVFGTEASPAPSPSGGAGKVFGAPKAVAETVRSAPERPVGEENIGSRLLKLMGWTQGEGLGKGRQGTTDIVHTKVYRPGAGLGSAAAVPTANRADGAEAIGSTTGGVVFKGYQDRARDRARERLAQQLHST